MRVVELVAAVAAGSTTDGGTADLLLGDDFFPWIVLALGAAMVVGNVLALVRPPAGGGQAPVGRAVAMIVVGVVAAIWGVASLVA